MIFGWKNSPQWVAHYERVKQARFDLIQARRDTSMRGAIEAMKVKASQDRIFKDMYKVSDIWP